MRSRLVVLVAFALLVAGCSPVEIDGILDEFGSVDMSESDDAAIRTAGESAIEVLTIREAEENLERGVAERNLDAIRRARDLRPDDPRYELYESAVLIGEGGEGEAGQESMQAGLDAMRGAAQNMADAYPELSGKERGRLTMEMYMEALLDVIESTPSSPERDRTIEAYCFYLVDWYPQFWTEEFPQEVALFLATQADFSVCPS